MYRGTWASHGLSRLGVYQLGKGWRWADIVNGTGMRRVGGNTERHPLWSGAQIKAGFLEVTSGVNPQKSAG